MLDGRYPARVVGPLATEVPRFRTELIRLGFTPRTAQGNAYVMAHLSWWLEAENLAPAELTTVQVERFVEARRAFGYRRWLTVRALSKHLGYLRELGLVPQPESGEISAVERIVLDFGPRLSPLLL
ncbi:hypothetical protein ACQEVF_06320 [Nonomuraea polychroma]|uniref:hypothetical protein n=1 Tax=Nonomuraea polychroma TaxID=46176 RepID=UPI003D8EB27C